MDAALGAGAAVVAIAVLAIPVGLLAIFLGNRRDVYLYGLVAMVAAFIVTALAAAVIGSILPEADLRWVFLVIAAPLIEETARMAGIVVVSAALQQRRDWLLFGLGFGLIETALKLLGRFEANAVNTGMDADWALAALFVPIVPLCLHVFLTVVAVALYRVGWSSLKAGATAAALHALHNWSSTTWIPEDVPGLYVMLIVRTVIFLVLIALVLRLSRGLRRVTSAPAHANSVP